MNLAALVVADNSLSEDFIDGILDVHTRKQAAMVARQLALGEGKANGGTKYTWPEAMGLKITSRRDAAARRWAERPG